MFINECFYCGYFYKAEGDPVHYCHFEGPAGMAPCESDEYEYETEDVDYDEW